MVLNNTENSIKRKIEQIGIPLRDWNISINYGIKTGFNEAFIINTQQRNEFVEKCPEADEIIRPILLGKNIKRYDYYWENFWLINSHNGIKSKGIPRIKVEEEYPVLFEYLLQFKNKLVERQDQGDHWTNLRNCAYLDEFSKPKITWGNLALKAQFAFVDNEYLINNPSPFFSTDNLYFLAILNSALADYYLKQLGVSRSGGYMEYKPMFVEQLPIPQTTEEEQLVFSYMVEEVLKKRKIGKDTSFEEQVIDEAVFKLYQATSQEAEFVLAALKR